MDPQFPPIVSRSGDPERLRGGAPHRGHKISCLLLVFLFAMVFLAGILILSLRQNEETGKQEASIVSNAYPEPPNQAEQVNISPATTLPRLEATTQSPGSFFDHKAQALRDLLDETDAHQLSQEEHLRAKYSHFIFHNVSSNDFAHTSQLLRNRSTESNLPQYLTKKNMIPLRAVMESLAINLASPQRHDSIASIPILERTHDETFAYELELKELRSHLEDFLGVIEEVPLDSAPLKNVKEYLEIQEDLDTGDENATSDTEEETVDKLLELNEVRVVPMSRTKNCFEGERICGINGSECFSERMRCDGKIDCSDFADELNCSACSTFIDMGYMGISRQGVFECDGHLDCPNGEDEKDCREGRTCESHEHFCAQDDICIPSSLRCDFKTDCPDGSDEKGCISLWPEDLNELDTPFSIASPHSSGILHWRFNDSWKALSLLEEERDGFMEERMRNICTEILLHDEGVLPKDHPIHHHFRDSSNNISHINRKPANPDQASSTVILDCGSIDCGARSYAYQPEMMDVSSFFKQRIVGGKETMPFDWPSVVAIYIDGILLCGGVLVDKNWVLSAAHCYKAIKEGVSVVEVAAGMSRVDSRSPYTQVRQIKEIIHHGHFNGTYLTHDVAMMYFEEPIAFNAKVNLVCLNEDESLPAVGEHCYTVGWGSTHEAENNVNNELLEVEVPIKSKCIQSYNDMEHQICGGFHTGGRDACQGDSGGPLYCANAGADGFNRHYLAGIVSHGIGCARPETDGVYVRITFYRDWIKRIIDIKQNELDNRRYARSVSQRASFERFRSMAKEKHPDVPFVYRLLNRDCPSGVRCDGNRCIPKSRVCDGKVHCMDRLDELNCQMNDSGNREYVPGYWDTLSKLVTTPSTTTKTNKVTTSVATTQSTYVAVGENMHVYLKPKECGRNYFTCERLHECIPMDARCDLKKDCSDGSDEMGCSCVDYFRPNDTRICDGYLDCPDSSDEANCQFCGSRGDEYRCSLSSQCIAQSRVCDKVSDCQFGEDERHCISIIPYTQNEGINIVYSNNGERPLKYNHGYIALNYKGSWSPLCISNKSLWTSEMNDRVCQYQNSLRGLDYNYVGAKQITDPSFLNSPLRVETKDGSHLASYETTNPSFSTCEAGVVQTSCSETTRCGVSPLYSKIKEYESFETMDREGMFPWQVTLYVEGHYICGATLIHRNWIMTSKECSSKMNPSKRYVVARMGGHRNGKFLSPHEQVRQVIQFTRIPHTGISLGTFNSAVDLGEYVNTICIPSSNWFPAKGKCVISGIDHKAGILNRGVKMTVEEICEINETYDYSVCTEAINKNEDVCMDNWSGTLSCLDSFNRYYVVGVYHTSKGGCEDPEDPDRKRTPFPTKFRSVSTSTARDAIRKIVGIFNTNESIWHGAVEKCGTHRCPLGRCLKAEEICNGIPDCEDMSDESAYHCMHKQPPPLFQGAASSRCSSINATHCACNPQEFLCEKSHVCMHESKFCDGVDDCGDASDEPPGCGVCLTALKTVRPEAICDGKVDCLGGPPEVIGSDESAGACCGGNPSNSTFRCVSGNMAAHEGLIVGPGCVERSSICDHCKGHASGGDCGNGADDDNCLTISARDSSYTNDLFGRPHSSPQGYLHYLAYGKQYLYCAGVRFVEVLEKRNDLRERAAQILCQKEGFSLGGQMTFHETVEKQHVYSYEDKEDYESCKLVYIVCRNRPRPPQMRRNILVHM